MTVDRDDRFYLDYDVRALTIRQPFASLMLPPACKVETRTWNTTYRGYVLICAAQIHVKPWSLVTMCHEHQLHRMDECLAGKEDEIRKLRGFAIAIGMLVDVQPMTRQDEDRCFIKYMPKLYCHVFEDVQPILPFPWVGTLGYTGLDDRDKMKIRPIFSSSL